MPEVFIIAEGQTEETFLKHVVAPSLFPLKVFLKSIQMETSKGFRGGAVNFDRVKINALRLLKQHPRAVIGTFIDLYGLDTSFPGFRDSIKLTDVHARVRHLEAALHSAILGNVDCPPSRFLPHIQPYEFEGLLFADVQALSETDPNWSVNLERLKQVRSEFPSPEHINNSFEMKPSKRLEDILRPPYRKVLHGPQAAARIGLSTMEAECPHFHAWMQSLRALAAS